MIDDRQNSAFLLPGEVARAAGVSTDTLRHYEKKGVLARPRRGRNGYRQYPPTAIGRVRLIRSALAIGFTLDELARFLTERDRGGAPCREVRSLAAEKLRQIDDQIRSLTALREKLDALVTDWNERSANASGTERLGLLESLPAINGGAEKHELGGRRRSRSSPHTENDGEK